MAPLDRTRWEALRALLDVALELEPAVRPAWLAARRRDQPDLVAELEELLRREAAVEAERFLAPDREGPARDPLASGEARVLGPWQLERPLGAGGMGTVWLARRRDGRFEGTAAIKFLNLAVAGNEGERRFRREGDVLARLSHPNIARLLDAGVSPSGRPYLVLEHVDGAPLDAWCDARRLLPAARIRLFQQVLAAVAHAHANLIVHRDLKPSNILVSDAGAVKLLDFGIAKLLEQQQADGTVTKERPLTFDYAAPEQIRGDPVSIATDIYALGIVLYDLLAGRHPTNEGMLTSAARAWAIVEAAPMRLSRAVASTTNPEAAARLAETRGLPPARLRKIYAGDLDNIVAKALEKDPASRYGTVDAFAEDLTRYLAQRPVSARRPTWTYRAGRFVQRNRGTVLAAVAVALALLGATILTAVQAHVARVQRDAAVYEAQRADAQIEFQTLLLSEVGDRPMTMGEILDRGRDLLLHQYGGDPRLLASLLVQLSDRYAEIGARPVRADLLRRADSIATALRTIPLMAHLRCLRVDVLRSEGRYDEAWTALAAAESFAARTSDPVVRVACLHVRSSLASETGHAAQSEAAARGALAIKDALGHTRDATYYDLVSDLAYALGKGGHLREALATYDQMLASMDSGARGGMMSRAIEEHNAALVLVDLGETADAERMLHDALVRAAGADREGRIEWQLLIHYAEAALIEGHADSAHKYFGMIVARADSVTNPYWQGRGLFGLARAQIRLGQLAKARATIERFGRVARTFPALRNTDDQVPDTNVLAGLVFLASGAPAAAEARFFAALQTNGYYAGKKRVRLRPAALLAGETALALGHPDTALVYARAAHASAAVDTLAERRSSYVGEARLLEARALLASGDTTAARAAAATAAQALAVGAGASHPLTLKAQALLAALAAH